MPGEYRRQFTGEAGNKQVSSRVSGLRCGRMDVFTKSWKSIMQRTSMQGKTGDRCVIGGIYKCKDHPEATRAFKKAEVFPPCGRAGSHGTIWILVRKNP